ncbi:hypothetical protein BRARA_I01560 [Brassica rapa]|uniref:Uncharacterized protein n=1 Tax=Brassica campestris TaxID=3711 RepID=A0A397XW51_BRACM|nr:hypothetical protein BRARA_I01560 [Brassica rapa]
MLFLWTGMTSFVFSDEYSRTGIHGSTFSFTNLSPINLSPSSPPSLHFIVEPKTIPISLLNRLELASFVLFNEYFKTGVHDPLLLHQEVSLEDQPLYLPLLPCELHQRRLPTALTPSLGIPTKE